jgi:hypothetical protein
MATKTRMTSVDTYKFPQLLKDRVEVWPIVLLMEQRGWLDIKTRDFYTGFPSASAPNFTTGLVRPPSSPPIMDQYFSLDESLPFSQQTASTQVVPDVPVDQDTPSGGYGGYCIIS